MRRCLVDRRFPPGPAGYREAEDLFYSDFVERVAGATRLTDVDVVARAGSGPIADALGRGTGRREDSATFEPRCVAQVLAGLDEDTEVRIVQLSRGRHSGFLWCDRVRHLTGSGIAAGCYGCAACPFDHVGIVSKWERSSQWCQRVVAWGVAPPSRSNDR